MGTLLGLGFIIWVFYSTGKGLSDCDGSVEVFSYLGGIVFVLWILSLLIG
jgi:hypothetical protein